MKKALFLLLIALLITQLYCDDEEEEDEGDCHKKDASKVKDCESLKVGKGYHKCCFWDISGKDASGKKGEYKSCSPVTEKEYNDIKNVIKEMEDEGKKNGAKSYDVSIDCDSNYISFAILSLIILLL